MRTEHLYLRDILEATVSIQQFLNNVSKNEFLESDLLQSAIIQKFSVIGEAASNISESLKTRYPDVQWKEIIGIRNILVHVYFSVNWTLIWKTIREDVPVLHSRIRYILECEYPANSDREAK